MAADILRRIASKVLNCATMSENSMVSELRLRPRTTATKKIADRAIAEDITFGDVTPVLLTWPQLPEWAKDNEYIHTGFRPISNSYLESIRSCFYIHNESGNIHSHLLATLWMLFLPAYFYPFAQTHYKDAGADDWIIFGLFFLGGALCFALSTGYHTVSNHSHAVHDAYLRLDLLGITTVTAGCFSPGMWYTFPCLARETKMFWVSVRISSPAKLLKRAFSNDV
ncbi:MAG: hypothetical protein Q9191_005726 [Dirinaria sp. TL-2023a]